MPDRLHRDLMRAERSEQRLVELWRELEVQRVIINRIGVLVEFHLLRSTASTSGALTNKGEAT